ncbi:Na+/proline symporter [Catalinimonas alkaloidigena]|uniref:Na+/proline symporter n=1 Tax=Catalinimonas alkaloidigena TaxID=1075417 RepID=A0A1G9A1B8_9BACT|nr:sodium:solute symporter [Catalinimonas alkaloidigena]SDK21179.1 Na+/proline symporter [Catalinimonas alkaloidigena]
MNSLLILSLIAGYFAVLLVISHVTSRKANSDTFFRANRQAPWYVVAFGMIGASLSGVTFISVPGWVGTTQFTYFQLVLGYLLGYFVIGAVLLPLYYRLNLTTIYTYLEQRFGFWSYKTGSAFFLLSRTVGSALRLFLVANVLQLGIFDAWGVPFGVTVLITIVLIWLYTYRGGMGTVVWTDTLQTFCMLMAVAVSLYLIVQELPVGWAGFAKTVAESDYSTIFNWNPKEGSYFWKQFLSGAFIAIAMTGLDQDMMQKNLTCRSLRDSQKNMFWFTLALLPVNLLFLCLGTALYLYANAKGIEIPARTDDLYPLLALNHFTLVAGVLFVLGIVAAAYSSADSALTALTTSFCVDFLNVEKKPEEERQRTRRRVHIGFSLVLLVVILLFRALNDASVVSAVFTAAGYTYGPLLGLFSFGLILRRPVRDAWVPAVCVLAPVLTYLISLWASSHGHDIGFTLLILNGALTFFGLYLLSLGLPQPAPTEKAAVSVLRN